ncbi:hypothetical protein GCM10008025_28130 [Ornithinibacillus halotolerans]|uniref:Uncharacterized protein n=1 Tax=Ornithinibacillus halotolerans TaxID=1274357 RepID=A0A916S4P2_9BACI|nr:hypothetical protein GCM10008025_28130 [Ornithinibacillus halotolerans]
MEDAYSQDVLLVGVLPRNLERELLLLTLILFWNTKVKVLNDLDFHCLLKRKERALCISFPYVQKLTRGGDEKW